MNYARFVSATAIAAALGAAVFVGCSDSATDGGFVGGTPDATADNSTGNTSDASSQLTCATPRTLCSGACVDTSKDVENCGACGTACKTGEVCSAGKCATSCGESSTKCTIGGKETCVNAQTDNENCGACGTKCAAGSMCSAGKCAVTCTTGYNACTSAPVVDAGVSDAASDATSDAMSDAMSDAAVVDAGAFQPYCANFKTDSLNCGACGSKCSAGTTCQNGGCCVAGKTFCGSSCINTFSDPTNCGGCGVVCPANKNACSAGVCVSGPSGTGTLGDPYTTAGQASCKTYYTTFGAGVVKDGYYSVNPNGTPFVVYCDQTTAGGGWTRCLNFVNTSGEDVTNNSWFDTCVDYSNGAWQSGEVLVNLKNQAGVSQYASNGTKNGTWTYDNITSTTDQSNQFYSYNHNRIISLANTDKLMITGRFSSNSGCGGSFGNGYGITVYPSSPDYVNNPKMEVATYQHRVGGVGPRSFAGWTAAHEISYNNNTPFNSCSSTPSFLGSFELSVR